MSDAFLLYKHQTNCCMLTMTILCGYTSVTIFSLFFTECSNSTVSEITTRLWNRLYVCQWRQRSWRVVRSVTIW